MNDRSRRFAVYAARSGAVFKKELFSYSLQPAAYLAAAVMTAACAVRFFISGQFFTMGIGTGDLQLFFTAIPYVSILTVPVFTAGQWEADAAIFEASLPVSDLQLACAKWAAALCACLVALLPGAAVPASVSVFTETDAARLVTGYAGITCFTAAACAAGVFFSASVLSKTAAFLCTALALALSNAAHLLPLSVPLPHWLTEACNYVSFAWHFDAFGKGIVDTRDLAFYAVVSTGFLFAAAAVRSARKRGRAS
ncbi:ABC transporter permease [Treponema brennaborense]|uniref:ABC transporter permease n=1 Tax=Treponema brennaborense (strain DSM 12168 / CIP 105900 / DD5/3) TaxID=906968 RepID=F4LM40_TREBD|nr:ABC transporter permease [Treponema brennaborense]AEE16719.1 ABC transporter permease [Treponema brennaborense DSM 12168]